MRKKEVLDFEEIWNSEWCNSSHCSEKRSAIHGMSFLRNRTVKHFVRIFLHYKKKEFVFRIPKSQLRQGEKRFYVKGVSEMSRAMRLRGTIDFWVYVTKLAFDC
jgi:hypothetical protein